MSHLVIYKDLWRIVADMIDDPRTLLEIACISWPAFTLIQEERYTRKICWPLKRAFKLSREQYDAVYNMLACPATHKLLVGDVGSGKTFVSTFYVMRKYEELSLIHI